METRWRREKYLLCSAFLSTANALYLHSVKYKTTFVISRSFNKEVNWLTAVIEIFPPVQSFFSNTTFSSSDANKL